MSSQVASLELPQAEHLRIVTGTVVAGFCCFLQLYAPQPLLEQLRREFGDSEARVSLVISAASLAVALASPFVGLLADAIGRKRVIVPCLFALAAATFGCAFARTLDQLVFWRFVGGVCTPGVIAVTLAYISEEAAAHRTGSVTALYVTGTVVGGLCGRLAAAFTAQYLSWNWAFAVLGVMTLGGAAVVWMCLPRARRFSRHTDWRQGMRALGSHLSNPRLLATCLSGFTILFAHVGLFTYVNFYLGQEPFKLSTSQLGLVFLVYGLGIVITPMSGRLIDRVGHRAGLLLAVCLIVGGGLVTLAPVLALVILGVAMASSGVFVAQASASSHIGRAARGAKSAASGLYVGCYYLGGSVGATALAWPWKWGGWWAVVGCVIGLQVLVLGATWRFYEPEAKREAAGVLPVE